MNLQTTKARARWVNNGIPGFKGWLVSHPGTVVQFYVRLPHDGAIALFRKHVLPRMVEGGRK